MVKKEGNNDADECGLTPLHHLVTNCYAGSNYKETFQELISAGADMNAQDIWGRTPLSRALHCNARHYVVELLLKHGANQYIEDEDGLNCFQLLGFENKNPIIAEIFLEYAGKTREEIKLI